MVKHCKVCGKRLILIATGKEDIFCSQECLITFLKNPVPLMTGFPLDAHFSYRSKWEEAFSEFCNKHQFRWRYEPYAFRLSNKKWYIPDFLVNGHYIEIKGVWEAGAQKKVNLFREEYGNLIVLGKKILKHIGVVK